MPTGGVARGGRILVGVVGEDRLAPGVTLSGGKGDDRRSLGYLLLPVPSSPPGERVVASTRDTIGTSPDTDLLCIRDDPNEGCTLDARPRTAVIAAGPNIVPTTSPTRGSGYDSLTAPPRRGIAEPTGLRPCRDSFCCWEEASDNDCGAVDAAAEDGPRSPVSLNREERAFPVRPRMEGDLPTAEAAAVASTSTASFSVRKTP